MACSTVRYPLLRNPTVRHYAVAATQSCPSTAAMEIKILSNRVTVAALDTNSPVAQVAIVFKAGPRNETYDTQGTSHVLRIAAGLGSHRSSYFGITRNIQQLGGNLTAVSDRESIAYTLQVTRDHLDKALPYLEDVAIHQALKPWEISDQTPRLRYQISTIPETTRVMELLHKAAYRRGLGYSLYCPKRLVGKIESETLRHFVNTWFSGPRCAVVATGIPMSEIAAFANNLEVSSNDSCSEPSKYYGGELRKERNSPLASVALAVEGVGMNKEKEALAFSVLQNVAGAGPRVKWGTSNSSLTKAIASTAGSEPFAVSAFNTCYSDSGIFGLMLSASPTIAGSLTKTAFKWLKSLNISEADVARGKAELKTSVLYSSDSHQGQLDNLIQQALHKGQITPASAIATQIDKITTADVQNAAKKVSSGKISMVAIGDLSTVPYLDEL